MGILVFLKLDLFSPDIGSLIVKYLVQLAIWQALKDVIYKKSIFDSGGLWPDRMLQRVKKGNILLLLSSPIMKKMDGN